MAGAILFMGSDRIVEVFGDPRSVVVIERAGAFALGACISMSCTTAAALSMEGKSLWLLQSLPIPVKTIIHSKIAVNFTISIPAVLISSTMMVIGLRMKGISMLVAYLLPVAFGLMAAVWGMYINFRFPNYEWDNENEVVKQGASALLGLLPGFLIGFILAMIVGVTSINAEAAGLIGTIIIVGSAAGIYRILINKYNKLPI